MPTTSPFAISGLSLFEKACTITIGSVQISDIGLQQGLDVWFNVKRSIKADQPNHADLRISNLTAATRQAIASQLGPSDNATPVQIDAGYVGNVSTIFLGQLRNAMVSSQGPDYVCEIQAGDFDQGTIASRSTSTFGTGVTPWAIVQQLIQDMGCGMGNTATYQGLLLSSGIYQNGYVLKGNSYSHLQDLAWSLGLEVTMQSGCLQWTTIGGATGSANAYTVSSSTGLIGSPTIGVEGVKNNPKTPGLKKVKGFTGTLLTCETLLLPGLAPGQYIQVNGEFVQATCRILSMQTKGDTFANEWGHTIEGQPISASVGQILPTTQSQGAVL
jgi:baseplate hub protein gp41